MFELKREKSPCALSFQRGIEMKTNILSAAVLAASIGSALAADLPLLKAPPPVFVPAAAAVDGGYIGLNAGGTWTGDSSVTTLELPDTAIP